MDYQFSSGTVKAVAAEIQGPDAENIASIVQGIMNVANSIQNGWQGTDAEAYINALHQFEPDMQKLVGGTRLIGQYLSQTADIMDQREQERRNRAASELAS